MISEIAAGMPMRCSVARRQGSLMGSGKLVEGSVCVTV